MKPRGYAVMLAVLIAFSLAEYGATLLPWPRATVIALLLVLVLTQTAYFGLVSMHLKDETAALKRVAVLPAIIGAAYGLVLVSEAAWRHL